MDKGRVTAWCVGLLLTSSCCEALPFTPRIQLCRDDMYQSSNLCCLKCPAGQHKSAPCTSEGGSSVCSPCHAGTFTAHKNKLHFCLTCIQCSPDKEVVQSCTPTQDRVCRCKPETFCHQDHACEVCHKCKRCADGQTPIKNCTADSDRECSKSQDPNAPTDTWKIVLPVIVGVLVVMGVVMVFVYKKQKRLQCQSRKFCANSQGDATVEVSLESMQNAQNGSVQLPLLLSKVPGPDGSVTDEDPGLGDSSSEMSVLEQYPNRCTPPPPSSAHPWTSGPPCMRRNPQLVPLQGEESLKSCFEYFYALDIRFHKRFFRSLNVSDNDITYAERLDPEEAVYELLSKWQQKTGREASLNHLLQKLRDLDQNLMADEVIHKATAHGHYEVQPTEPQE